MIGLFTIMLFLAVIGALSEISQFSKLGDVGKSLVLLVTVIFIVHGALTFGAARMFRLDPAAAAVASHARTVDIRKSLGCITAAKSCDRIKDAFIKCKGDIHIG